MSTREEQYEALYGPLAKFSEYKRGERIRYRLDNQQETGGVILWICEPGEIAGKQQPTCYIVQNDLVGGFPDTIYQSDIIQ